MPSPNHFTLPKSQQKSQLQAESGLLLPQLKDPVGDQAAIQVDVGEAIQIAWWLADVDPGIWHR